MTTSRDNAHLCTFDDILDFSPNICLQIGDLNVSFQGKREISKSPKGRSLAPLNLAIRTTVHIFKMGGSESRVF